MLLYLSLLTSTLNVFDCVDRGDGKSVLVVEPSILCEVSDDPRYGRLKSLAIVFAILYVAGIPLLVAFLLFWSRSRGPASAGKKLVRESVHFLLEPYKPEYFYWKLVEMVRKVLLVTLPRLMSSDYPELQGSLLTSLFGAFIVHNYFACPYAVSERGGDFYNAAEMVSYVCVIVITTNGISLNTAIEKSLGSVGTVYTVLALLSLFIGVFFFLFVGYKYRGTKATTVAVEGLVEKVGGEGNDGRGGGDASGGRGSPSKSTVVSMNPVSSDSKASKGRVAAGVDSASGTKGESDEEMKNLQAQLQHMKEENNKLNATLESISSENNQLKCLLEEGSKK